MIRDDGKRPDGITLVLWQTGKCLRWDAKVVDTMALSYVSVRIGRAADAVAERKSMKYTSISNTHISVPEANGTLGLFVHELVILVGD